VGAAACVAGAAPRAEAEDLAAIVARARDQVESGSYADAMKTLRALPPSGVPAALAVEAALLETTAALVTSGAEAGEAACAKAIAAAGYDPEIARDQSPKVRTACRSAAGKERGKRVEKASITFDELTVERPDVAWQPVRVSVKASSVPGWLRVVARVTSTALEGSFDLALAPSVEGPLRGTLDPSWIRPKAKIQVELVAVDKFGDLGSTSKSASIEVPSAEAMITLGEVPATAAVTVDGAKVALGPGGKAPVSPGQHAIEMVLDDGSSASTSIEVKRGGVSRVALNPQKGATGRTLAWISTGTSVALLAVGGVLLLNADSRRSEIEELSAKREEGTDLPATEYSEIAAKDEDRQTFATAGSVLMIAGGAVGALAITLWLWPDSGGAKKTGQPAVTPVIGLGRAGLAGTF
jgi:hypothetical protein